MHGTHVELKKLMTTQLPLRRARSNGSSSMVVLRTEGAGLPMSGLSTNPTLSSVPDLLAARIQNRPASTAATPSTMNGATRRRDGAG